MIISVTCEIKLVNLLKIVLIIPCNKHLQISFENWLRCIQIYLSKDNSFPNFYSKEWNASSPNNPFCNQVIDIDQIV